MDLDPPFGPVRRHACSVANSWLLSSRADLIKRRANQAGNAIVLIQLDFFNFLDVAKVQHQGII
jgi:hypothetical protein